MRIGIPKEIKPQEHRVGLGHEHVAQLIKQGHQVVVERGAGVDAGSSDEDYIQAGASIVDTATAWQQELIIKVKEVLPSEYDYLYPGQILFTYLHLAANQDLLDALLQHRVRAFAYETLQEEDASLPLLAPMSEVAGKVAFLLATYGERALEGGAGHLPIAISYVEPCRVVILGCGSVGTSSAEAALALGNKVYAYEINPERKSKVARILPEIVWLDTLEACYQMMKQADITICAMLHPGGKAEKLISQSLLSQMQPGSVIMDVSIDQGGSIEGFDTITTHERPFVKVHGVQLCTIANLPGTYPKTSSRALHHATFPYILALANQSMSTNIKHPILKSACNTFDGACTHEAVANTFGYPYHSL
ncbi:MAG: alanine dehydrogenase [Erysipelotrichaceae bacterium]